MSLSLRQAELIKYYEVPHTLYDVMGEFNCSYFIARRETLRLVDMKLAMETAFGEGKKKKYRSVFSLQDGETVEHLIFGVSRRLTALQVISEFTTRSESNIPHRMIKTPAWTLAKVLQTYNTSPEESGFPTVEYMRKQLADCSKFFYQFHQMYEQLLAAPVWDNDAKVQLLLGRLEPDWELINNLSLELTDQARNWD